MIQWSIFKFCNPWGHYHGRICKNGYIWNNLHTDWHKSPGFCCNGTLALFLRICLYQFLIGGVWIKIFTVGRRATLAYNRSRALTHLTDREFTKLTFIVPHGLWKNTIQAASPGEGGNTPSVRVGRDVPPFRPPFHISPPPHPTHHLHPTPPSTPPHLTHPHPGWVFKCQICHSVPKDSKYPSPQLVGESKIIS